jgi:3-oxoacyl-[acyl-carrier-protein] synthase II
MNRRAVITGLGPISCIGIGINAFRQGLLSEKSGIGKLSLFPPREGRASCAGEIHNFHPEEWFPKHRLKRLDRYAQFSVASAKLALADAGLAPAPQNPTERGGVSFGTALGGICNAESENEKFLRGGPKATNQTLALQVFGGSAHSNIAIEFGLQGPGTTNSNSCASGPVALGEALQWIRRGLADFVIAGAAEAPLSPLTYNAFDWISTMSRREPPEACCPFDLRRDGFVMGEGAAALVVEDYEHACKRGARIYAELLGGSLTNDAHHMTTPNPAKRPVVRAIQIALNDAGIDPAEIDAVNAHASSTKINDSNEAACLAEVFGARLPVLPVQGTKAYTAHPLGATGALEAIICCLSVSEGWLAPTLHYREPDPDCPLDVVANHVREARIRYMLSNSFGFGGINSCVVFGAT